jgi:HlyD family secretion protein
MKRFFFWMIAFGIVVGAGAAGFSSLHGSRRGAGNGMYRTAVVRRGEVTAVVTSTGTVQPVLNVQIGSFVSGPIKEVCVDFNSKVKAGQLLAKIDPRIYEATVIHEKASLAHAAADLVRVQALLDQALSNEKRALQLKPTNAIAETDLDEYLANRKSLQAQVKLAAAVIQECEANLATANTNLEFCAIKSPVDGVVIDRKVDPGQTLAAAFQTPTMFVVAPDLDKKVYVYASVDEADIGRIRDAKIRQQPVSFLVDAYPNDVFQGHIAQVRLNPTTVQNVVTYTVIVEAPNPEIKLIPGLTASLTFQVEKHTQALTIANTALRFRPTADQVRPQDRAILEGENLDGESNLVANSASSDEVAAPSRDRNHKIVWILDGELLAALQIVTGLSDKNCTEIVSDNLSEGQEVVVGKKTVAVP